MNNEILKKIDDNIINNCNFILKGKNIEIIK